MSKIGILTQPLGHNYGGIMQAFALQEVLRSMGHSVVTIDFVKQSSFLRKFASLAYRVLAGKPINYVPYNRKSRELLSRYTSRFIEKWISLSPRFKDPVSVAKYCLSESFDTLMVGSDQVWREAFLHSTLLYHSIEKGFLHHTIRPFFAKDKVVLLLTILNDNQIDGHWDSTQIQSAISNLCNYYEWHNSRGLDLYFFSDSTYQFLEKKIINRYPSILVESPEDYFGHVSSDFYDFALSRASVREFTGEMISHDILDKVIELANSAPSACNRQGVFVNVVENEEMIRQILTIQGGLSGYTQCIKQLIVVTVDRSYYYSLGERNHFYIDGGIYLMNLLYSLHYYRIAACTAHWGLLPSADKKLMKLLDFPESWQTISLIAIGRATNDVRRTLSLRRKPSENLNYYS